MGFDLIHNTGVLDFASHPKAGHKNSLDPFELLKGKKIFGTWGGDIELEKDLIRISKYITSSEIDIDVICGQIFNLEDINQAFHHLELAKAGRPIINLERL
jgi:Zn-dependent alcohol dehydrogenase